MSTIDYLQFCCHRVKNILRFCDLSKLRDMDRTCNIFRCLLSSTLAKNSNRTRIDRSKAKVIFLLITNIQLQTILKWMHIRVYQSLRSCHVIYVSTTYAVAFPFQGIKTPRNKKLCNTCFMARNTTRTTHFTS